VRERLHRVHRRRDRRHLVGADAGRRRPDEDDLVGVLAAGDLAAVDVEERILREGAAPVAVLVEVRVHLRVVVGADGLAADGHVLADPRLDVLGREVEALRGEGERERRILLPVIVHDERLEAHRAVLVDSIVEETYARDVLADLRNRDLRAVRVQERAARVGEPADRVPRHIFRQRLVGLARRGEIGDVGEVDRNDHVAGGLHGGREPHVRVERGGRLGEELADLGHFRRGRGPLRRGRGAADRRDARHVGRDRGIGLVVDVEHLLDVGETGVLLASKKKTVLPITFTLAAASWSISLACTSRDHGQRPMLAIDCSSMAMTATLSLGAFEVMRRPMS
jgi:hypothetical protein